VRTQVVVHGIPTCCDHVTRAIVFDGKQRFYVQLGSGSNVDPNSTVLLPHQQSTILVRACTRI
jgi:glucose/arabinose dehydrogenase